jgi:hypothetical protein
VVPALREVWVGCQGCVGGVMSFWGSWGIVSLVGYEMNAYGPSGVAVGGWRFVRRW